MLQSAMTDSGQVGDFGTAVGLAHPGLKQGQGGPVTPQLHFNPRRGQGGVEPSQTVEPPAADGRSDD